MEGAPRMAPRRHRHAGIVRFTGSMTPVWIFSEKVNANHPLSHTPRASRAHLRHLSVGLSSAHARRRAAPHEFRAPRSEPSLGPAQA